MDRVSFFNRIDGINCPELISQFFDQFIALESLIDDRCLISVLSNTETAIEFQVNFPDQRSAGLALQNILRPDKVIQVYNRPITVNAVPLADSIIKIRLE